MVLHLGDHDGVARTEVGRTPRTGEQVERLGGVLGEDDLVGGRRVDEAGDLGSGSFERLGGAHGEIVGTSMHVRVGGLVVLVHRVDDGLGLLRGVARVEIDQRLVVHLLLKDGKSRLMSAGMLIAQTPNRT